MNPRLHLFAILYLLFSILSLPAATVTGNLTDISIQALDTKLVFTPTNDVLITPSGLNAGPPKLVETAGGQFSIALEAGDYIVTLPLIPWRKPFGISVMDTTDTINITNLLAAPKTYTYTNNLDFTFKATPGDTAPNVLGAKLEAGSALAKSTNTIGTAQTIVLSIPTNAQIRALSVSLDGPQLYYDWLGISNGLVNLPAFNSKFSGTHRPGLYFINTNTHEMGYIGSWADHGNQIDTPELLIQSARSLALIPGTDGAGGANVQLGQSNPSHDLFYAQYDDDPTTTSWTDGITSWPIGHSKRFGFAARGAINSSIYGEALPGIVGVVAATNINTSLDGTWIYGGGSDQWDGSTNGGIFINGGFGVGNKPGGWTVYTESGVTFLRMQDTGDPRTAQPSGTFSDPSNRKLMMARSMANLDGASSSQLSDGFTVCFRARIPTPAKATGALDPLYPSAGLPGNPGPTAYPAGGDGYVTFNGGKGNIMMHDQSSPPAGDLTYGASIAFSLTQTNDNNGSSTNQAGFAGLTMNELNGSSASNNVNFGQGSGTNLYALDPTDWHEFWITLKADPSGRGTHEAYVFVDGNLIPKLFHMTAGASEGSVDPSGAGYRGSTFIAIASPSTGQSCAFDLDFLDYKLGEFYPAGAINNLPPQIGANAPAFGQPFYPVSSNLFLEATTAGTNNIPTGGAKLTLNGVDVSAGLVASGSAQDRTFTYPSLQPNTVYTGNIIVSDQAARSVTNSFSFDTFVEAQVTILESEDYNFDSGQGSNSPPAGAFANLTGTYGVDFIDSSLWSVGVYRPADAVDTDVTTDLARPRFINSGATDYQIGFIARGEWCNYKRTISAGSYSAVLRATAGTAQDVRLDLVTSNPSLPNQTVKSLGVFHVPNTGGLSVFTDVILADMQGNPLPLALSGDTTLRLTAVSANNTDLALNYLVLATTTAPTTPVVSTSPAPNATGVLPDAAVEAAIYDGSTPVNSGSVVLRVNGSVVSANVVKSGSVTLVKYTPPTLWPVLSSNTVNLTFTNGTPHSVTWSFTAAYLLSLTPAMKVNNAATPGFAFRVFQNGSDDTPSTARAETQLAGSSTFTNRADPSQQGPADAPGVPGSDPDHDPLSYTVPTVINMSQGNANYGNFAPDDLMPGIPGIGPEGGKDGISAEIKAFISLPAGVTTMVVNSDDGFKVTAGFLNDAPLQLVDVEGLFGDADRLFRFIVQEAGVYPFRMVWYQSDHGFGVEWMVVNADGTHGLINDTANTQQTGPAAFQTGTVPAAPHPTLTIQRAESGQVTITWGANGTLQAATSVTGQYQDILSAVSPYTTTATGTTFYRVRVP